MASKAVLTLFEAGIDIVIDRDAKLDSQENSVVFSAGENIRFEDTKSVEQSAKKPLKSLIASCLSQLWASWTSGPLTSIAI